MVATLVPKRLSSIYNAISIGLLCNLKWINSSDPAHYVPNWSHPIENMDYIILYLSLLESGSRVSMDFLSGQPTTQNKHDPIWVVVCHFRKMALFIPCTNTTTTTQTTKLYFQNIWPHFVLPSNIVSYRDSRFLNTFWKTIWELLGCQLKFFTSFHPQTDGQRKVFNRVLVDSLCTHFGHNK